MKLRLILPLLCAMPVWATDLSLPLQNLMEQHSVSQLLRGENRVSLTQTGTDNLASLLQRGSGNSITLTQQGQTQQSTVIQLGENNRVYALLVGSNNELELEQIGHSNQARLFLGGSGSKLDLHQHGDANLMDVGIYSVSPMDSPLSITQSGSERTLCIGIY